MILNLPNAFIFCVLSGVLIFVLAGLTLNQKAFRKQYFRQREFWGRPVPAQPDEVKIESIRKVLLLNCFLLWVFSTIIALLISSIQPIALILYPIIALPISIIYYRKIISATRGGSAE